MKTLIAIPCMDMIPVPFASSLLNLKKSEDTAYAFNANALIYDSRNQFAANAIEKGYDRILWLDSDMVLEPDAMERLAADMDEGREMVCGLCFKRHFPSIPVIYKRLEYHVEESEGKRRVKPEAESWLDYPKNEVFEIQGCGFGCVMMSVDLLKRVWDNYGPPFDPATQIGEDLACCLRVRDLGAKMYCDSRVKCGHVGTLIYDERVYLGQRTSERTDNG